MFTMSLSNTMSELAVNNWFFFLKFKKILLYEKIRVFQKSNPIFSEKVCYEYE